jgi:signal transduction histidine kinase
MKYYKFSGIIFLMAFYFPLQAQEFEYLTIDSLKVLLDEEPTRKQDKSLILKELAYRNKSESREEALEYVGQALELAESVSYQKGIAESTHTLGLIQFYLGDYDLALSNYLKALAIREVLKDEIGLGRSYNNIGVIYKKMGKYGLAENYFNRGLLLRIEIKDSLGIAYSYNNLGEIHLDKKNIKKAIFNYKTGLEITKKIKGGEKARAFILGNLGNLYQKEKKYELALKFYDKALLILTAEGGDYDIAKNLIATGNIKILQNNFDSALVDLKKGLVLAEQLQAKPLLRDAYEALSKSHAGIGNYEAAYLSHVAYDRFQDSLMSTSISNKILVLQARYENEKRERELLEQDNKIEILYRSLAILISFFFVIFFFFLFYRYRQQVEVNESLKVTKAEIEKKNQQLAAYTKELEEFTYIASHDLKEPLRVIGGFTLMLNRYHRDVLSEKGRQYLDFIMVGVEQMTDLLKGLLQYSEIKRLKQENLKWVDLNGLMLSVQNILSGRLLKCNGQVILNNLPKIYSNSFQITQLFKNLISNSLKFQQEGQTPVVAVSGKDIGESWEFRVKDNGIGIDKSYHYKVFEMFKRLHKREDYEGTGMGLAICKQIVEQHGGNILIDSELGKGTTFVFTFPKSIIQK